MLKVVGWLGLAAAGVLLPLAVAAAYDVTGSSPPEPFQTGARAIPATVDIDPDTLNLRSEGQPVTVYMELPTGFEVSNIQVGSLRLCLGTDPCSDGVAPDAAPGTKPKVGDADHDDVPDLKVQFARPEVIALVGEHRGETPITVSGRVDPPGRWFAGTDTIRVSDPGRGGKPADGSTEGEETPSPPPSPVATVEYTLRPGESVWDVAAFFGTTVETIVALNGLADANLVVAGQRLLVPEPAAGAGAPPPVFTSEYVVQPGETLTDIAARFGTTVEALATANRLANPSVIHYGYRLLVP
jgi:LysM repeat protein